MTGEQRRSIHLVATADRGTVLANPEMVETITTELLHKLAEMETSYVIDVARLSDPDHRHLFRWDHDRGDIMLDANGSDFDNAELRMSAERPLPVCWSDLPVVECSYCDGTGRVPEHHEPWATEMLGCQECRGRGVVLP